MILSNREILAAIKVGHINIDPLAGSDPFKAPFNTTAVDLRLGPKISVLKKGSFTIDLRSPGIAKLLTDNSTHHEIVGNITYTLPPHELILAQTLEKVSFPVNPKWPCYCARVEGKSSIARCGVLVHFTAPTIHAGWNGPITLEIINLGPNDFLLSHEMYICQLIVEKVHGKPSDSPNQFKNQKTRRAKVTGLFGSVVAF